MTPDFVGVTEAARIAKMSKRRLQKLIELGRGPQFHPVMGRKGFIPSEVKAWAKNREKLPPGRPRKAAAD